MLRSAREPRSPLRPDARSSDAQASCGRRCAWRRSAALRAGTSQPVAPRRALVRRSTRWPRARRAGAAELRPGAVAVSRCLDACAIRRTGALDSDPAGAWGRSPHIKKHSGRVGGERRAARARPTLRRAADGGVGGGVGLRSRAHLSAVAPGREALSTLRTRCVRDPAHGRLRLRSGGGVGAQPPHQETVRAGGWGAARSARSSDARAATQAARRLTAPGGAPPADALALHAGQQETVRGRVVRQRTTAGRRHLRARLPGRVGGLAACRDAHLAIFA